MSLTELHELDVRDASSMDVEGELPGSFSFWVCVL
jgi:hypothetical protein